MLIAITILCLLAVRQYCHLEELRQELDAMRFDLTSLRADAAERKEKQAAARLKAWEN